MRKKIYLISIVIIIITILPLLLKRIFTDNSEYSKDITTTEETIYWDCTNVTEDELNISSIFQNYSLLPLENSEESLVGHISKIEIYDNLLFLLDEKYLARVFVFNANNGKFIRTIGKIGQGPGEYLGLNDFSIDKDNKKIHFLCEQNMIYTYSLDGHFFNIKKMPFYASNMEYQNGRFYFRCDIRSTHHLIITDEDINIISKHLKTDIYKNADRRQIHHFQKRGEGITFHRFLDNNIYKINQDGKLYIGYQLYLGDDAKNMEEVSNLTSQEIKERLKREITYYKYFSENNKYAFVVFIKKGIPYISIYNKLTNHSQTYKYHNLKNDFLNNDDLLLEYESHTNGFLGTLSLETIDWLTSKGKLLSTDSYETNPVLIHLE